MVPQEGTQMAQVVMGAFCTMLIAKEIFTKENSRQATKKPQITEWNSWQPSLDWKH